MNRPDPTIIENDQGNEEEWWGNIDYHTVRGKTAFAIKISYMLSDSFASALVSLCLQGIKATCLDLDMTFSSIMTVLACSFQPDDLYSVLPFGVIMTYCILRGCLPVLSAKHRLCLLILSHSSFRD